MRSPHKVASVLLGFVVCSTIFSDYWEYSKQYHANPDTWMDVLRGTADAPQQYRIGVPRVADFLRQHGHMGLRDGFTLVDLFGAAVAVYLLFALFERSRVYRAASETGRWFGAAAFVFLVQFYFAWITWYQRPETMASAAVVAATLWLLTVRLPGSRAVSMALTASGMLALAAMQGFPFGPMSSLRSMWGFSDVPDPRGQWFCAASVDAGGDECRGRVDCRRNPVLPDARGVPACRVWDDEGVPTP